MATIQWYPGHMVKGKRLVEENLALVDVIMELVDARLPLASRNPDIKSLTERKPRIIILNKSDLADPLQTKLWLQWFSGQGEIAIALSSSTGENLNRLPAAVQPLAAEALQKWVNKGRKPRAARLMMVGIPNVGKSSLINQLIGSRKAAAANRPGLTRQIQWVRIRGDLDLLDMPGILMPKINDQTVGMKLAATGAISDEVYNLEEVGRFLAAWLAAAYPKLLTERYCLTVPLPGDGELLLAQIGRNKGCLVAGNLVDLNRTAQMLLDDFRSGKIGRISLELPPVGQKAGQ
ncbi:MAG: ribosome biogenesis GTPase YlqF [Negativicutes bacterium]|nr:ribosome biogenesis GTPase YlqF [Negativicutes bacterium]